MGYIREWDVQHRRGEEKREYECGSIEKRAGNIERRSGGNGTLFGILVYDYYYYTTKRVRAARLAVHSTRE
jgi:hypothetical protein